MSDSQNSTLFRNLCILHLQRLTLELKCPLCLNLLNNPIVFPCNHIFCNGCIAMSEQNKRKCPSCELECVDQEIRSAPYMESIVRLCQSLEETVNAKAYEHSSAGKFSKQTPSSINMRCNSKKEHPSEILQKRIYATSQLADSVNSSKGETDTKKLRKAECEEVESGEVERIPVCVTITEDVNTMIKKEMNTESCKVVEGNSKGDSVNYCRNGGRDFKKLNPATCVEVEQNLDSIIIIDNDEDADTTIKDSPQTEDCKVAGGDNKSLNRESPGNVSDKKLVHSAKTLTWTTTKKRKRLDVEDKSFLESDSPSQRGVHCSKTEKQRRDAKSTKHCSVPHSSPSNTANIKRSVCAFCHSSEENEGTGHMIGFADKRKIYLTSVSNFARSKVVIVHEKCVDWSPKIFYKNEIIQNLESEVARAAKLKCKSCGKKGASLGCFLETCPKTYHIPCAYFTPESRWDCEKYLMLCPSHSSCKFPGEMSEPEECSNGESHPPYETALKQSDFWGKRPGGKKELVLCGSALSAEDKAQVENFATTYGVNVSNSWNQNITHIIASTDATGACIRTFQFLMAILNGKWIVRLDWIKASIEENHLLDELNYEIELENHGCRYGPKTGRLRFSGNGPKLFAGLRFYFSGDFDLDELNELSELVKAGGGIIENRESMMASRVGAAPKSRYVVYNYNPPEGNPIGDFSFRHHRLREAVDVAVEIGAGVLSHKWILDSIAGCKLVPLAVT